MVDLKKYHPLLQPTRNMNNHNVLGLYNSSIRFLRNRNYCGHGHTFSAN